MVYKLLSVTETAKLLGISRVAVVKQIQSGKIKAEKVGRSYVIEKENLNIVREQEVTPTQKKNIEKAVKKVIHEYGKTLQLLQDA